jgi:hypothetical protein
MKLINTLSGGYRRVMDTLLGLQTEMITAVNAPFAALGYDLVLSGCTVTNNNNGTVSIAPGIMYVSGQMVRFDGAANIPANGSQAIILGNATTSVPWPFADGSSKNLYSEIKAVVGVQDPNNNTQLKIKTTLYNLQLYIQDQIYQSETIGTIKTIKDSTGTFIDNFDENGNGVTPRWINWAIDKDSAGRAIIGAGIYTDPISGLETTYAPGATLGEVDHVLTPTEAPTPAGLPPGVNGPHQKPGDGGGTSIYYLSGPLQNGANAATGHNNMQPSIVYYRVEKVA